MTQFGKYDYERTNELVFESETLRMIASGDL